jgi:hypothetical protein
MSIKATEWPTATRTKKLFPEHSNTKNLDFIVFTLLLVRNFIQQAEKYPNHVFTRLVESDRLAECPSKT